jgi:hypothetical protein
MDNQLQELIELQKEQNQLLKKHLTRIRFSLWALLVLMTLTGVGLGMGVYLTRPKTAAFVPTTGTTTYGRFMLSTGTINEVPISPPPAASSTGVWEATPQTTLPSVNVSEIIK